MKCFVCFKFKLLSLANAKILPGVPTTMWGQFVLRTCSSFFMLMPPKKTPTLMAGMYFENRSYSLLIWNANSLVWHKTRTSTWLSIGSICCKVARTNTAVFPIPLFACDTMSMPRIACGMHSCCTAKNKCTINHNNITMTNIVFTLQFYWSKVIPILKQVLDSSKCWFVRVKQYQNKL